MAGEPIDGQVLLLAAAKASVPPTRLPDLVDVAQAYLEGELEAYRREYERLHAGDGLEAFLVGTDHWAELGETLGMDQRERSAVRRAHEEQLLRVGRRTERDGEFESALEIRDPVCVGTDGRCRRDG